MKAVSKVALFVIVASIAMMCMIPSEKSAERKVEDMRKYQESKAYILAMSAVKKKLKNPKGADFPGILERKGHVKKMKGDGVVYVVDSYVDALNSFGATVRTDFLARVEFLGKDGIVSELFFE